MGAKRVGRVGRRLRSLRRAAGRVRDLDVAIEQLQAEAAERSGAEAAAARALAAAAGEARVDALARFIKTVERTSPERLARGVSRLIASIDARGSSDSSAGPFGRRVLRQHADDLRAASHADLSDIENVHQLRIVLKRLRYALEILGACVHQESRRPLYRELLALQERLGVINDLAVMSARLAQCVDADGGDVVGAPRRGIAALAKRHAKRLEAEHRSFIEFWATSDTRVIGSRTFIDRLERALQAEAVIPILGEVEPKLAAPGTHLNGHAPSELSTRPGAASRIAAIDVGTNSLRLIVAESSPDGSYRVLDDEKEVTRLGRGLHATGRLDPAAIEHSAVAIARMKSIAEGYGASKIRIVATAAARQASNGQELALAVLERTGLPMEIISAEQEAMLAYRSASRAFDLRSTVSAVVDIGGGSTEVVLSVGRDSRSNAPGIVDRALNPTAPGPGVAGGVSGMVERVFTIPIGAVELTERFGGGSEADAGSGEWYRRVRRFAKRVVREHMGRVPVTPQLVVGTGGTLTTLGAMALHRELGTPDATLFAGVLQGYEVPRSEIRHLLEYLRKLPLKDRAAVPGLSADRADIIVAGLVIVDAVLKRLDANRVRVHEGGIRDGLLLSMIRPSASSAGELADHGDPLAAVRRLARSCAYEEAHSLHVAGLALEIFDQLQSEFAAAAPETGFDPARIRQMLEAAAILHDIGYLINYAAHHKHSYHLIVHADLPGWTSREVQIIASVARYHRCAAPKKRHRAFGVLPKPDRRLVRALAGILRIADGLDRTHIQRVRSVAIQASETGVRFDVSAPDEPGVDLWGAARKSSLFERAFGRPVQFEWRQPAASVRSTDPSRSGQLVGVASR